MLPHFLHDWWSWSPCAGLESVYTGGLFSVRVTSLEPAFGSCFPSLSSLNTMQSDLTFPDTSSVYLGLSLRVRES